MKAIVIGAGISGLTTAFYLQRSGVQTLVLEKAATPGGISTSWKRKGYTFEGGIHWLIGAKEDIPLHRIWLETGALRDNNPVYFKDPIYTLVDDAGLMPLYRDLHDLDVHGFRDRLALASLKFHLWCFRYFHQPIGDLTRLKVRHPSPFNLWEYVKMLPAVAITPFLWMQSARSYARRFASQRIRNVLSALVDPGINALSLIYTLSTFNMGDSGYPEGGSIRMAGNMAGTFTALGGEIKYRTPVQEVLPSGKKWAVRTSDGLFEADAVVISVDTRTAIDKLFAAPLQEKWARKMRQGLRTTQCMFLGVGVKADLSGRPRSMIIALPQPLEAAGITYNVLVVNNYSTVKEYAPEGGSVLTCLLHGPSYGYWKAAREDGTYIARKQEVMDKFLQAMALVIPELEGNVEVTDVATPVTYERYCDTFEGSYMSDWPAFKPTYKAPIRYRKGLYFTGQRTAYSGGLPLAAQSGRQAAQWVCRDFGLEFINR